MELLRLASLITAMSLLVACGSSTSETNDENANNNGDEQNDGNGQSHNGELSAEVDIDESADQNIGAITLDASNSNSELTNLSYQWLLVSAPTGSESSIDNANSASTILRSDLPGEYQVALIIRDSESNEVNTTLNLVVVDGDQDGDGLLSSVELELGLDPDAADSNFDGIDDSLEDADEDLISNIEDNCPSIDNTSQSDMDGDAVGDLCDDDIDGDTVLNTADNCPNTANTDQLDLNENGLGDACENDTDADGVANENDVDQDGDGLIEIATLEELDWIRNNLAGTSLIDHDGLVFAEGCNEQCKGYELVADLDFDTNDDGVLDRNDTYFDYHNNLRDEGWLPIGAEEESGEPFTGDFEGNGHAINNLYINRSISEAITSGHYLGLFHSIEGDADQYSEIQNLVLGGDLGNITGEQFVATLAGSAKYVTARNINVSSDVHSLAPFFEGATGGVIAYTEHTDLIDGSFNGSVSSDGFYVGGIVAVMEDESSIENYSVVLDASGDQAVGGAVGRAVRSALSQITVSGSVQAEVSGAGGLVGSGLATVIELCEVQASISVAQLGMAGGIIGSSSFDNINRCHFDGTVSATQRSGGIIGSSEGSIIRGSSAIGSVHFVYYEESSVPNEGYYFGGAIGYGNNMEIESSFASVDVSGTHYIGGFGGALTASITSSLSTGAIDTLIATLNYGQFSGTFVGSTENNHYLDSGDDTAAIGAHALTETQLAQHFSGFDAGQLQCPTTGSDTSCGEDRVLYFDWENSSDDQGSVFWDFGNSDELPGLILGDEVVRASI